jgi:CDGSH-type Zn-finger protein
MLSQSIKTHTFTTRTAPVRPARSSIKVRAEGIINPGRFRYLINTEELLTDLQSISPTRPSSLPCPSALPFPSLSFQTGIDKGNPKVVNTVVVPTDLDDKPMVAYCRCWRSGTFPKCDGKHVAHNKDTGDNVGPLLVKNAE